MTRIFVGGISYNTTNQQLKDLFSQHGQVDSADVVMDKFSGRSKGFAFVEMPDDAQAQAAIQALDGQMVAERKIGVSVARPREERPSGGGFKPGGFSGG